MARTVAQIQAAIIADVQAQPELAGASSTSRRAIWVLWTWVVAAAIALMEQLEDIFTAEVEGIVALSAPQTAQWLQDKVLKFQYSATNPQVLQLIDLVPQYPVVDTTLQIVTRASVKADLSNRVKIKVAKQSPPVALLTAEVTALQTYVNTLGVAGISYIVSSGNADNLRVEAQIYYAGAYSAVISTNVIAAINGYFAALPFDGVFKLSDLELTIRGVVGVNDVVFVNVQARADSTPLSSATYLVQAQTLIGRQWPTVAGYIIGETTSGNTLADTLTFIPE